MVSKLVLKGGYVGIQELVQITTSVAILVEFGLRVLRIAVFGFGGLLLGGLTNFKQIILALSLLMASHRWLLHPGIQGYIGIYMGCMGVCRAI